MKKGGLLKTILLVSTLVLSSCSFSIENIFQSTSKTEEEFPEEEIVSIPENTEQNTEENIQDTNETGPESQENNFEEEKEDTENENQENIPEETEPKETEPEETEPNETEPEETDPEVIEPEVIDPEVDQFEEIKTFDLRMPAEFEPCEMVKMCYPINMPIDAYKTIAEDNKILLLCNPSNWGLSRISQARSEFENAGVNVDNVTFIDMNIDDDYTYWVRDFSPFYVFDKTELSIVDFTYNRSTRTEQNGVPKKLANYFNMKYSKMDLVHTGGNLMQDGKGTAFSDDLVVRENSNNKTKVLNEMKDYTGTDDYVITIDPQGDYIAHIDCWAKIVAPDKIIVAKLPQSNSRYSYYEQVANELANTKCSYGYNYKIYRVEELGGNTVAPYTNSLIANKHVYVPLGDNSSYNQKALNVYKEALPGYEIHGIKGYNNDLSFKNTDALHCRTHEIPDKNMLFIDSRDVLNGEIEYKDKYVVKTNIVSYSNSDVNESDVKIYYSINNGDYTESEMSKYKDTTNFTFEFTGLNHGDDIRYYIEASDSSLNKNVDPSCGSLDPHHFTIK